MKCSPLLNPCAHITSASCTQIPQPILCKGDISPNIEPLGMLWTWDKIVIIIIIIILNTDMLHHTT